MSILLHCIAAAARLRLRALPKRGKRGEAAFQSLSLSTPAATLNSYGTDRGIAARGNHDDSTQLRCLLRGLKMS
jgi:hypothetical protein